MLSGLQTAGPQRGRAALGGQAVSSAGEPAAVHHEAPDDHPSAVPQPGHGDQHPAQLHPLLHELLRHYADPRGLEGEINLVYLLL